MQDFISYIAKTYSAYIVGEKKRGPAHTITLDLDGLVLELTAHPETKNVVVKSQATYGTNGGSEKVLKSLGLNRMLCDGGYRLAAKFNLIDGASRADKIIVGMRTASEKLSKITVEEVA